MIQSGFRVAARIYLPINVAMGAHFILPRLILDTPRGPIEAVSDLQA